MTNIAIVTGDNMLIYQRLMVEDANFPATGMSVKSRLVSRDRKTALTDVIVNAAGTQDADWANGRIGVIIPGEQTKDINCAAYPEVLLETQVSDGTYEKTWFSLHPLVQGNVD